MKHLLTEYCASLGIDQVGIAPACLYTKVGEKLEQRIARGHTIEFDELRTEKRIDPRLYFADAQAVIVCLFPYYTGTAAGANLSKYTYALDYHHIIKRKLDAIGCYLKSQDPHFEWQSHCDTGPLVDRYLAWQAGLGFYGLNSCLINDKYGSWFFIGYLITNYPFPVDSPLEKTCLACGVCQTACPGRCILGDGSIDPRHCKSYITQKKGPLTESEISILKKTNLLFGCDVCQDVCPHNVHIPQTPLTDFRANLLYRIESSDLAQLSNQDFRHRYGNRAFSWRGKQILQRNAEYVRED